MRERHIPEDLESCKADLLTKASVATSDLGCVVKAALVLPDEGALSTTVCSCKFWFAGQSMTCCGRSHNDLCQVPRFKLLQTIDLHSSGQRSVGGS